MSEDKAIKQRVWVSVLTVALILIIDQVIKVMVKTHMCVGERVQVTDWFQIFFTENKGMAFGLDFFGTFFLALFRLVAVGGFSYLLAKLIRKKAPVGLIICWACLIAGAAGNIIDNCFYGLVFSESSVHYGPVATLVPWGEGYGKFLSGRVVDMFYFPLFTWPDWVPILGGGTFFGAVFNFADAAISCGAVALVLFYHKYLNAEYIFDLKKEEENASQSNNKQK